MNESDVAGLAQALAARYAAARALTEQIRQEVDSDQLQRLDDLTARRAEELQMAGDIVGIIGRRTEGFAAELRDLVQTELAALIKEDQLLRALLAARAQEVPAQLAALRGSLAALGGYQTGGVPAESDAPVSDPLDRRG